MRLGNTLIHPNTILAFGGMVAALLIGLLVPRFQGAVVSLGRHIPRQDVSGDYLIAIFWAALLAGVLILLPGASSDRIHLLFAWFIRCVVTLGLMLITEAYYEWDAYSYFANASADKYGWSGFTLGSGSHNVQQLLWLHNSLIMESYHAAKVTWSMFSLLGLYLVYRAAVVLLGRTDRRIYYVLMLTPSVLFWSSMLGKEPISLLGMGLYVFGTVSWYKTGKWKYLWLTVLGIIVVTMIRSWYGPLLVVPMAAFSVFPRSTGSRTSMNLISRISLLFLLGVGLFVAWNSSQFSDSFESTETLLDTTSTINNNFAKGGSAVETANYNGLSGFIASLPLGTFTALFRPLPGEVVNIFGFLSGVENLFILLLAIYGVVRLRIRTIRNPMFIWAATLVLLWAVMYGATAASNLGAIVRYRLQIMPLLLGVIAYLVSHNAIRKDPKVERRLPAMADQLPSSPSSMGGRR